MEIAPWFFFAWMRVYPDLRHAQIPHNRTHSNKVQAELKRLREPRAASTGLLETRV